MVLQNRQEDCQEYKPQEAITQPVPLKVLEDARPKALGLIVSEVFGPRSQSSTATRPCPFAITLLLLAWGVGIHRLSPDTRALKGPFRLTDSHGVSQIANPTLEIICSVQDGAPSAQEAKGNGYGKCNKYSRSAGDKHFISPSGNLGTTNRRKHYHIEHLGYHDPLIITESKTSLL